MGILDLFRPKWKNSYESIRIEAVEELTDELILTKMALFDISHHVRFLAVQKITDQDALAKIALEDDDRHVRQVAVEKRVIFVEKITDQDALTKIALSDKDSYVRYIAIKKIGDQKTLVQIALSDNDDYSVRGSVIEKIDDQKILAQIALSVDNHIVRDYATKNLTNQTILAQIALSDDDYSVRHSATKKIIDQKVLGQIALSDEYYDVRNEAVQKLKNQTILTKIAIEEVVSDIALVAAKKITNQSNLSKIALQADTDPAREFAAPLVTNELAKGKLALSSLDHFVREEIIKNIIDEFILAQIIQIGEQHSKILKHAMKNTPTDGTYFKHKDQESELIEKVKNLTDSNKLSEIAQNHILINVRIEAILKINDQDILIQISKNEIVYKVRLTAIKRIINFNTLLDISKTDWDSQMREEVFLLLLERLRSKNIIDEATENLSKEITISLLKALKSNYKSPETKESFLPYLFKSPKPEVFDKAFKWHFNTFHPLSQSTIELLKHHLHDYFDILFDLRTYEIKVKTTYKGDQYQYTNEDLMTQATKKLCEIKTPVSSNLLHLITMRKGISVTVSLTCGLTRDDNLDWHTQKGLAIHELRERGNPMYDSSLYLEPKAWQIK